MKYSTAKTILKIYRKEGRVEKKKSKPQMATHKADLQACAEKDKGGDSSRDTPRSSTPAQLPQISTLIDAKTGSEHPWPTFVLPTPVPQLPPDFWALQLTAHIQAVDSPLNKYKGLIYG